MQVKSHRVISITNKNTRALQPRQKYRGRPVIYLITIISCALLGAELIGLQCGGRPFGRGVVSDG